jgi:alpha-ketoglutarate-dependent taurine dioxygenase
MPVREYFESTHRFSTKRRHVGSLALEMVSETVGVDVYGLDQDRRAHHNDPDSRLLESRNHYEVQLFQEMHLHDDTHVGFSKRAGQAVAVPRHPIPELSVVSSYPVKTSVTEHNKVTFDWHSDGTTEEDDDIPNMAGVMSAKVISEDGGAEFGNTHVPNDDLSRQDKSRFSEPRVLHSICGSQRCRLVNPKPELKAFLESRPKGEHPIVWTDCNGRCSSALGAGADDVVAMDLKEGRTDSDRGAGRSGDAPGSVYRHDCMVGDLVIWDNRGLLHRACPYEETSPRELYRTKIQGDEPIQ